MRVRTALALAMALLVVGCANIGYYAQAIVGHGELMAAARPIEETLADPGTDAALRRQLETVRAARDFAGRKLALPDNGSYRSYAELHRPYVVWNVFAAPELSVEPREWCLLFVGCVRYRGYFDEGAARRSAEELRQEGFDVYVGGVTAYSTLGYFDDPVLDTFLRLGDIEAVRTIFHELAHQVVYVRGDTAFNESFAVAVEEEGVRRWLRQGQADRLPDFEAWLDRKAQFYRLVADCRERLRILYASSLSPEDKLRAKALAYADLRQAYLAQKAAWKGYAAYDRWFSQPLNNALLASVGLYTRWLPSFRALLDREQGDLPAFYKRVADLAKLPETERAEALGRLAAGVHPD